MTESGSAYRLGQPGEVAVALAAATTAGGSDYATGFRRSSRATGKESVLDAFGESEHAVGDADEHLAYVVGGSDVGGACAERIMRSAFTTLDDNLVMLRAQYTCARRVVLFKQGVPVASAVVEVHADQSVLEVPILAAERQYDGRPRTSREAATPSLARELASSRLARSLSRARRRLVISLISISAASHTLSLPLCRRSSRQQGHGSVLNAVLVELGCRLRLGMLIVSATQESMRFWLRQGLHTAAHCPPPVRAALRKIDQTTRRGFANSVSMAMELPSRRGAALQKVLKRIAKRVSASARTLAASEAPAVIGYVDVNSSGNFFLQPDGKRLPVVYSAAERLAVNVPYNRLEAFPCGQRGWGVRCGVPITQGQVVIEVRGRCLSEEEYEELADPSYVVSFDDKLLQLKRLADDDVRYIDLKEYAKRGRRQTLPARMHPRTHSRQRVLPRRTLAPPRLSLILASPLALSPSRSPFRLSISRSPRRSPLTTTPLLRACAGTAT